MTAPYVSLDHNTNKKTAGGKKVPHVRIQQTQARQQKDRSEEKDESFVIHRCSAQCPLPMVGSGSQYGHIVRTSTYNPRYTVVQPVQGSGKLSFQGHGNVAGKQSEEQLQEQYSPHLGLTI